MASSTPSPDSLAALAKELGILPKVLDAVVQVESSGMGLFPERAKTPKGRLIEFHPVIRLEAHVFWRELKKVKLDPRSYLPANAHIISEKRNDRLVTTQAREWDRLEDARLIHRDAADRSTSWGRFQIMGFNWEACGAADIGDFVEAQFSHDGQLRLFAGFLRANPGMVRALKRLDWAGFAKLYNGAGYAQAGYDRKLAREYAR
jgi:hypothetical protein